MMKEITVEEFVQEVKDMVVIGSYISVMILHHLKCL